MNQSINKSINPKQRVLTCHVHEQDLSKARSYQPFLSLSVKFPTNRNKILLKHKENTICCFQTSFYYELTPFMQLFDKSNSRWSLEIKLFKSITSLFICANSVRWHINTNGSPCAAWPGKNNSTGSQG